MVDAEICEETRSILGALIRRPKLSDKLLSKPPFRFLHDVVTNVTKATGFADGLYEGDELSGSSIKGKGPKCSYLDKIINCVGIALGEVIDIRTGKVVAGLEAECTCIFLQALGRAASDSSVDSAEAVRRTLDGEQMGEGPAARRGGGSGGGKTAEAEDAGGKSAADDEQEAQEREAAARRETEHREEEDERRRREEERRQREKDEATAREEAEERARRERASAEAAAAAERDAGSKSGGGGAAANALPDLTGDWEDTKALMEQIIQRPRMQEKLLRKPPFRYLHDVLMAVYRETNFLAGLYEDNEMNSKMVKEKEAKINFLRKAVGTVNHFYGTTLEVQPRKIVAGMEADLTNKFLQAVAHAALSGVSSDAYVQSTLTGAPVGSGGEPAKAAAPKARDQSGFTEQTTKKSPDAKPSRDAGGKSQESSAFGSKQPEQSEKPGRRKPAGRPMTARHRPPQIKSNVVDAKREEVKQNTAAAIMREGDVSSDDDEPAPQPAMASDLASKIDDDGPKSKLVRDILDDEEKKKKADEALRAKDETKAKAGAPPAGQPTIRMGKLGKKKKKHKHHKHGHHHKHHHSSAGEKTSDSAGNGISKSQLEHLRESIQNLCQSVNPLGKCMDYVPDDIAQMSKEIEEWRSMHRDKADIPGESKDDRDEHLKDLKDRKNELDDKIEAQQVKINSVKATIARNDQRIHELLRMVVAVQ